MTKSKKQRKPKTTAQQRFRTVTEAAIRKTMTHMTFYGASAIRGVRIGGFKRLLTLLRNPALAAECEVVIKTRLRTVPRNWYVWWGLYFETADRGKWTETGTLVLENLTVSEFDALFKLALEAEINQRHELYGEAAGKGYGWVATHDSTVDFKATEEHFIEMFADIGCYDETLAHRNIIEYRIEQNLMGRATNISAGQAEILANAYRQFDGTTQRVVLEDV